MSKDGDGKAGCWGLESKYGCQWFLITIKFI